MKNLDNLGFDASELAVLRDFVESWESHQGPILFVGSGMSRFETVAKPGTSSSANIMDWNELTASFHWSANGTRTGGSPDVAQAYEDANGRRRLIDKIQQAIPQHLFDPGPAFQTLAQIEWASVITTNYDHFLERTFEHCGRAFVKIVKDEDISEARPKDAFELVKMHGDLQHSDTIVLSTDDYQRYSERRALLLGHLRTLLAKHPVLFLGFSLTDPNVTQIIEWLVDRVGTMRPRAVSLIHGPADPIHQQSWLKRGVQLVRLPSGVKVCEFIEGLYHLWRPLPKRGDGEDLSSARARLRQAMEDRSAGWTERVAELVSEITRRRDQAELHDAVHRVLYGTFDGATGAEIRSVLELLAADTRRAFLLAARRAGIIQGHGRDGAEVAVEDSLLEDAQLAPIHRAEVLLLRAERRADQAALEEAKSDLKEALPLFGNADADADAKLRLRRLLLRIGDEDMVDSWLHLPVDPADACALARCGADHLMVHGRVAALPWFERARAAARSNDQKTVAVVGMQICEEPGRWRALSDLEVFWPSIQSGERPRVDEISALEERAARELLNRFRKNTHTEQVHPNAIEHLVAALDVADDMGFPRSPSPNFSGTPERLAYTLVGLLFREGATGDELEQGLRTLSERGLLRVADTLPIATTERATRVLSPARLRQNLLRHSEPLFRRRARKLLASAFLPVLSDQEIDSHVAETLEVSALKQKAFETSTPELHLELLQRNYSCFPRAAALSLISFFVRIYSDDELDRLRHAKWVTLPIYDWSRTGVVRGRDDQLERLQEAIALGLESEALPSDEFALARALAILDECTAAGLVSASPKARLLAALDNCIERGIAASSDASTIFSLALARHELEPIVPSRGLQELFLTGYGRLRGSSSAGTWMNLVDIVGRHLPPEEKARVAENVDDYTSLTLQQDADSPFRGSFPDWPAMAIRNAVDSGIFTPERGWRAILKLSEAFPQCIVRSLGMQGAALAQSCQVLLDARAEGRIGWRSIFQFCTRVPKGSQPLPELERALLAQLLWMDSEDKKFGYWSLGWLAENEALSPESCAELHAVLLSRGICDPDPKVRAASVTAAARAAAEFGQGELDAIQRAAEADLVADVRRAGGMLALRRS